MSEDDNDSYYYLENTLSVEEDQEMFLPDKMSFDQLKEHFKRKQDEHSYD